MLAQGYDIKSAAEALGISAHAVSERLRGARRKLGVSSSREAARILSGAEAPHPIISVPRKSGDDADRSSRRSAQAGRSRWRGPIIAAFLGGIVVTMLIALALFAPDPSVTSAAPRVVRTMPAAGAEIPAGRFTLSVTYDRPMRAEAYSFVQTSPETYPQCTGQPVQSRDGRTYSLECRASAGKHYEVWFNRAPYANFMSREGVAAEPFVLRFRSAAGR